MRGFNDNYFADVSNTFVGLFYESYTTTMMTKTEKKTELSYIWTKKKTTRK